MRLAWTNKNQKMRMYCEAGEGTRTCVFGCT